MLAFLNRALHTAERTRAYLHRVVASLAASGVLVGVVTAIVGSERTGVTIAVLCAVLGVSPAVATANTTTKKQDGSANTVVLILVAVILGLVVLALLGVVHLHRI